MELKIRENVKRDIVILSVPKREQHIKTLLSCLKTLDPKKYKLIIVCNTEENEEARKFSKNIKQFNKANIPCQVVYSPEKTIPTGRNKGLLQSIENIKEGTRLTYIVDDDIVIYKPREVFRFLEQGLQYAAFVGYPSFEVGPLEIDKQVIEAKNLVKEVLDDGDIQTSSGFLEVEKPRRYTPFKGEKFENAYVLYGHVHGNLQLHFTKVLEKLHNGGNTTSLFSPNRSWYGEFTEFNYRLQRYGLIGGYLLRTRNKIEHLHNADKFGLVFHNNLVPALSPTRTMAKRNENMLRSYIYLAMESDTIPSDLKKGEFVKRFIELLDSDFRFLRKSVQEFAKLLQVRYSTKHYLLGKENITNKEFEKERKILIEKIVDEIYSNKEIKDFIIKRKIEYETAPFKHLPFEQFTKRGFNTLRRYQNEILKGFREDIYDYV